MEQEFLTVSSKGQIVIPADTRKRLGIKTGTRLRFRQEGMDLVFRPETERTAQQLIDQLCGITAGGDSLTDDLLADRRAEEEKSGW
jgi:AbrB family looped-hinge helix DNA binding protein